MSQWDKQNVEDKYDRPKIRVLLVDDEEDFTRLLRANLELTGRYDVQMINVPGQALSAARQFQPDLIVLDFLMPGMDGGEVATAIRADQSLQDTPILFLTAAVSNPNVDDWVNKISGPCLAEPITPDDLIAWIQIHLPK